MVSGLGVRVPEYLENLKAEFETLAHDANLFKMQRDDYDRKLQAQLGELNNIQQTLYDLERNHTKIKQQYEEEIIRLRRQIELQSGNSSGSSSFTRSISPSPNLPPSNNTSTISRDVAQSRSSVSSTGSSTTQDKGYMFSSGGLPSLDPKRSHPSANTGPSTASSNKRSREPDFYATNQVPPGNVPFSGVNQLESSLPIKQQHKTETTSHEVLEEKIKPVDKIERRVDSSKDKIVEESSDWIVGFNPGVQTNLNINLMHTLEHQSVVCCVKFSSDGKWMSTGCNKSAQIYDVETGEKVHTFSEDIAKDGDLYIRSVCFSPDNKFLAAGAEDKTVKLWDIESKRLHHTFVGHELDIYSLDFSKDGKFIVSGSGDKKAKIWDVEKGECLFTLGNEEVGPKDGVTSVAFSPDGRLVAAGSLDRIVRLWDAQTGYFLERYEGHLDSVYSVAFSPDGKTLASGSLDKTLKLWDLSGTRTRSRCRSNFSGHKDFVLSVAFSPDGNWLISGSKDRSVQFWDPRSAVSHMMLQGHKNSVISVAVSPSGGVLATGSGDFRARIWKYE